MRQGDGVYYQYAFSIGRYALCLERSSCSDIYGSNWDPVWHLNLHRLPTRRLAKLWVERYRTPHYVETFRDE